MNTERGVSFEPTRDAPPMDPLIELSRGGRVATCEGRRSGGSWEVRLVVHDEVFGASFFTRLQPVELHRRSAAEADARPSARTRRGVGVMGPSSVGGGAPYIAVSADDKLGHPMDLARPDQRLPAVRFA